MDCSVCRKAIVMRPGISLMHLDIRRPAWSSSALVYWKRISEQERGRGNVARCRCRGRGRDEVYRGEMVMPRRRIDPSLSASHNQTSDQTVPPGLSTSKGQNEPVFIDHMVTPWLCSALCCLLYTTRRAYGIGTVHVRMYAFFGIAPVSNHSVGCLVYQLFMLEANESFSFLEKGKNSYAGMVFQQDYS